MSNKLLKVRLVDPNNAIKVGGRRRTGASTFNLEDNEGTRRMIRSNILVNLGEVKQKSSSSSNESEGKKEKKEDKKDGGSKAGGTEKLKL